MSAPWLYLGAFSASLVMAFGFTPLALRIAKRKEILDHPGDYKKQESAVPYLGGLAIVLSFAIVVLAGALVRPLQTFSLQIPLIIGCALVLSFVGLLDDLKNVNPAIRFLIEVGAAVALFFAGVQVQIFAQATWLNILITVLWIVGVSNAFNLLDNMDGLSAGVATIASLFFFIISAANGQVLVAALSLALAGCSLGFLRHNFHPAKIYMGDAGSLFLGFVLSVIGLKLQFQGPVQVTFVVPILILGIPIFDTILVVTTRLAHRINPFLGGRDHTSHRIVFVGIPVPAAVALIYTGAVCLGWLALCVSRVDIGTGYMLAGLALGVGSVMGVLLGRVPVYEQSKRRRMMLVEVQQHEEEPERNELTEASS